MYFFFRKPLTTVNVVLQGLFDKTSGAWINLLNPPGIIYRSMSENLEDAAAQLFIDYSHAFHAQDLLLKKKLSRTFLVNSILAGLCIAFCVFKHNKWFSAWFCQLLLLSIHVFGICHDLLISTGLFEHLSYHSLLCQRKYPSKQVCRLLLQCLIANLSYHSLLWQRKYSAKQVCRLLSQYLIANNWIANVE